MKKKNGANFRTDSINGAETNATRCFSAWRRWQDVTTSSKIHCLTRSNFYLSLFSNVSICPTPVFSTFFPPKNKKWIERLTMLVLNLLLFSFYSMATPNGVLKQDFNPFPAGVAPQVVPRDSSSEGVNPWLVCRGWAGGGILISDGAFFHTVCCGEVPSSASGSAGMSMLI